MRFKRFIVFCLVSGLVTILCHGGTFTPLSRILFAPHNTDTHNAHEPRLINYVGIPINNSAKKPKAKDDVGITSEETALILNIVLNDLIEDDDEGEDDDNGNGNTPIIDPTSVDLDPLTPAIDRALEVSSGNYTVNIAGLLTYVPAQNYVGVSSINYTIKDLSGNTSKPAAVTITVNNVNDPPVITGQNPNPITTNEGQSVVISLSHLIVTDPDNNYPDNFVLTVGPGDHYTVSQTTVIPEAGYSGAIVVPVTVNDGEATSNTFNLQITVNSVNDPPVITGQTPNPLTTSEEQPITLQLANLTVTDADDSYPTGFTLHVSAGAGYTVSGTMITPSANFNGVLSVPVVVNDGEHNSNTFNVQISVTPVNDVPNITGQTPNPLTTPEDQPIAVAPTNLSVTDPDDIYPQDFTLIFSSPAPGSHYTVSGNTITPEPNFFGNLTVPVTVNDGEANSNLFELQITVTESNDAPVITGQSLLSADEDNTITVSLSSLLVSDSDNPYPTGFSLLLSPGTNYTVSGPVIIPTANYSGPLTVPVTVSDGSDTSQPFNLQITVNPINDAPVITAQTPLTILENESLDLSLSQLSVTDPDDVYPTDFTLTVLTGANYTVAQNRITPAPGFTGTLSVGISVNDGEASSAVYNLQITVNPVNDPPVITSQRALSVAEDNALTILLSDLTVTDTDNAYPTGFTLNVLPGSNYSNLSNTIMPSPNFTGTLSVGVTVSDGTNSSAVFNLQVSVVPVNDAPVISSQQPLSVSEDQSLTLQFSHFAVADPDNTYPTGFSLMVFSGANYTVLQNTITPVPNFHGLLKVQVQVNDGALNSNIYETQINVTPVNDAPIITGQAIVNTPEETPVALQLAHLTVIDVDNSYPSGFTMNVSAGANYTVQGTTITPVLDFTGTLNVSLTVSDGISASAPFIFQIQVGNANDPPVITGQSALVTNEEQPITISLSHLTVTDPDNPYPTGFTLLISEGLYYTASGSTITPALNFAGMLTVPVRVNDGVNNSPTFQLQIQVNQINDAPGFDAIPNQKVAENSAEVKITINNISKGPGENDQQLTFVVTSGNIAIVPNPVISYDPAATTAMLTFKPAANASGVVTITVVAVDNGSTGDPHKNTYSSTFQIEVSEINSAPTLEAIANVVVQEDADQQNIALNGITAGAGESQPLTIQATTDKPELFETLQVVYASPEATGTLQIKPKTNQNGVAAITVAVTDNGNGVAPSINTVARSFTFTIQAVNDMPVFISTPGPLAVVNEPYEYIAEVSDVEGGTLPLSAVAKPAWSSLTAMGNGKAKLSGVPPVDATGTAVVRLQVTDGGVAVEQQYSLLVNTRPVINSTDVSLQEDGTFTLGMQHFTEVYKDANQHAITGILITQKPGFGKLLLADNEIKNNDTLSVGSLANLVYKPDPNHAGQDVFYWKASDGYHFSLAAAPVNINIAPVNDGPAVILETDTLKYEVNGEPALLTSLFEIDDPDDDSLTHAEVVFRLQNFKAEFDMLLFENIAGIRGQYDFVTGKLTLTGKAPIEAYEEAIRSIQYTHLNTLDPDLKVKSVSITLNDGKVWGEAKDRFIDLKYTFIELEIPSGFTPNGDNANDTWVITRPGGLDQLHEAVIKVFNRRGVQVFHAEGFDRPWDGTLNGEFLPADTYFFTIDLKLRTNKTYKGIVTILR